MQVVAIYYWIYGGQFCSGEAVIYRYIPAPPPPPAALYRYNIASRQYYSGGSNVPLHRAISIRNRNRNRIRN